MFSRLFSDDGRLFQWCLSDGFCWQCLGEFNESDGLPSGGVGWSYGGPKLTTRGYFLLLHYSSEPLLEVFLAMESRLSSNASQMSFVPD